MIKRSQITMPTTEQIIALDLTYVRSQFPSLAQTVNGHPAAFLDGPGGTQVPQRVIDAISDYLRQQQRQYRRSLCHQPPYRRHDRRSAQRNGRLPALRCRRSRLRSEHDHADFRHQSRAIGRDLKPGDEIVRHPPRSRRQRFAVARHGGRSRRHRPLGRDPRRRLHARHGRSGSQDQFEHETGRRRIRLQRGRHDQSRETRLSDSPIRPARSPTSTPSTTARTA